MTQVTGWRRARPLVTARPLALLAALALTFGAGVIAGRGVHPKLWLGIAPAGNASILQQQRRSAQLHDAVYFFGDSQMEGFAASNLAPNSGNFGIAGDNTPGLAARLPGYRFAGARLVVIESGDNDWGRDRFADFPVAYPKMLAEAPSRLPTITVAVAPPARRWAYRPAPTPSDVARANAVVRRACEARPGCRFVAPPLAGPDGYALPAYTEADGEHLSAAGYAVWRVALAPLLQMPRQ